MIEADRQRAGRQRKIGGLAVFRRGSGVRPIIVIAAVVAVVLAVGWVRASSSPAVSPSPGFDSAIEACHLPTSDPKAGGTFSWQLAVRLDSPQQTDMLFTSGWSRLTCTTYRSADGSYSSSTTGIGGDPNAPETDDALTYETGNVPSRGSQFPTQLIVGRMPRATASIQVVTSDGERHDATLGKGWYMVYAAVNRGDYVVEVAAYDAAGTVIARLADPTGVQPGATAAS